MVKIDQNFFYPGITIHTPIESPCQVDKTYDFLKKFIVIFGPIKPKNSDIIRLNQTFPSLILAQKV
jgi:hypothetical protein